MSMWRRGVIAVLLLCALCAWGGEALPLTRGTYWVYRGSGEWQQPDGILRCRFTFRMAVTEVVHRGALTAAVLRGHPEDYCWYTPGRRPGTYLILRTGQRYYQFSGEQATAVLARVRDPHDALRDLYRAEDMILDLPLSLNQQFGCSPDIAPRTDGWYCWHVERVTPRTRRPRHGHPVPATAYTLAYRTNPDHTLVTFVPGIDITRFCYQHHGTTAECRLRLLAFHRGKQGA